jgi:hypothetical protein
MENNKKYNIGDNFPIIRFEYFEYLNNGGNPNEFKNKKYYNSIIKYITPTGSYVLDITDPVVDEVLDSMFLGEHIMNVFPEFELIKDKFYCITYSDDNQFY